MHFGRRPTSIQWFLLLLTVAAILPGGWSQTRTRRPSASRKCTLTGDEVDSLTELLDDIEAPVEDLSEGEDSEPEPAEGATVTPCTRDLERLRRSVRLLQHTYQKLKEDIDTVDVREYELRKNRYNQRKLDLTAKLEGLERQVTSQHRSKIVQLRNKLKAVEKQVATTVSELDRQRQQNADHFINLVATNVDARREYLVQRNFEQLMTYSTDPYGEIMKRVSSTRNMMTFLSKVDLQHQPIAGYEALLDTMIARRAVYGPEAMDLLKHIQSLILARDGQQQERAIALLKKFKKNAN